jgi:hypothetical protein
VTGDPATAGSNRCGLSSIIAALETDSPGNTLEQNMADPAAPTTSRPSRSGSKEPRTAAVSTDTENKLARAARSAQRLAELSDVPGDDSTLDLFPDDPTRTALQAMNIDVRQGTLTGFELPDEVLAAVEAAADEDGAPETPPETKAARRSVRAAQSEDIARVAQPEPEPEAVLTGVEQDPALTSVRSAFDVEVRDRQATAVSADASQTKAEDTGAADDTSPPAASPIAQPMAAASASGKPTPPRETAGDGRAVPERRPDTPSPQRSYASAPRVPFGASVGVSGGAAAAAQAAPRPTPELDHARAAAFADTVDALYGVIADQRRAAAEHSRRMRRMLSIVVGVLLVTVVIGVAQMLLLVRFTRDTTVQQQRIEQMLLGQQATLATLLQMDASPPTVPAAAAPAAPATNADAPAAVAPRQPADARSPAKTQHAHKHKPAATHAH